MTGSENTPITSPSQVIVNRDLPTEQQALPIFHQLVGYLPQSAADWRVFTLFTYFDLGRPTDLIRDLTLEGNGLAWFVHHIPRLPNSSLDWRLINAWGYGNAP